MEKKNENASDLNSGNLIVFFYNWRKPLILMTVLALVSSIIVSLLIENKYESTVVLFPTTTSSISKALLSENIGKEDILRLGEEEEAEQMLQILHSDEIRNRIIEKYNLAQHYEIDDDVEYKYTKLQKEYENNVTFKRTKFMSVEITVLDHNPDTAALIANDIAALLDTVKNRMRREIAVEALAIVQNEHDAQVAYIDALEDSLRIMRSMGIINVRAQSERLTEQMATAILEGKTKAVNELKIQLDTLSKYAGVFTSLEDEKVLEKKRLSLVRSKLREAEVDANQTLQHKFIVNNAFPAEKKSYPIRWLIVAVSTFSTFLLALVCILFMESIKSIKFD